MCTTLRNATLHAEKYIGTYSFIIFIIYAAYWKIYCFSVDYAYKFEINSPFRLIIMAGQTVLSLVSLVSPFFSLFLD